MGWILFCILIYIVFVKFFPDKSNCPNNDVFILFEDYANGVDTQQGGNEEF